MFVGWTAGQTAVQLTDGGSGGGGWGDPALGKGVVAHRVRSAVPGHPFTDGHSRTWGGGGDFRAGTPGRNRFIGKNRAPPEPGFSRGEGGMKRIRGCVISIEIIFLDHL